MATIAPPRSPVPQYGGPLLDVSLSRSNNHRKQTLLNVKRSLASSRSSPLTKQIPKPASSTSQNSHNQYKPVTGKEDQVLVSVADKKMASPAGNKRLQYSGPSTPSTRAPVTLASYLREKSLPPKPSLASQESPERRGVLDAMDLAVRSIDKHYPPLEPTSSPGSFNSTQRSPEDGMAKITPSLLSIEQNSNGSSPGVVEYGIAQSASIQAFNKPKGFGLKESPHTNIMKSLDQVDQVSFGNAMRHRPTDKYPLPTSSLAARKRLALPCHIGFCVNDNSSGSSQRPDVGSSESRPASLRSNVISNFNRDFPSEITSACETRIQTAREEAAVSDTVSLTSVTGSTINANENDFFGNASVRSNNDNCDSNRYSKYGYHIRESFDAHDIIMGNNGDSQIVKTTPEQNQKHLRSSRLSRNFMTHELRIQLATPTPKNKSKKGGNYESDDDLLLRSEGSCNITNRYSEKLHNEIGLKSKSRVSGTKSQLLSSHPPRTSSLQGTPPARSLKEAKVSHPVFSSQISLSKVANTITTVTKSATGDLYKATVSQPSSPSMLHRHTVASATRASLNGKKSANFRVSTSRMSHSRTLSSFSDVGKGMKKLGKRMGKIIPGRRPAAVPEEVKEKQETESMSSNSTAHLIPHRQVSCLLTTYENSGMSKVTEDELHFSAKTTDDFGKCEPTDRQESEQATKDKNAWHAASYGLIRVDGGMHFFGQSFGGARLPLGDGDDDDDPPNFRHGFIDRAGHYDEVELIPSDEGLAITNRESPLSTPTRTEYDFSEANSANILNSGIDVEANDPQASASEPSTDRSGAQNPIPTASPDASDNPTLVHNTNSTVSPVAPADARSFQSPVSVIDAERMLSEADAKIRELMTWATGLEESRLQDLVVTVCARLADCILQIRNAHVSFIQIGLAAEELICFIGNSVTQVEASVSQHRS